MKLPSFSVTFTLGDANKDSKPDASLSLSIGGHVLFSGSVDVPMEQGLSLLEAGCALLPAPLAPLARILVAGSRALVTPCSARTNSSGMT